ncbi:hypothetical protein [Xylocopilactobacillus apis]|uniref:Uncharacterized protein n=1 Tax=Xylocopilactobacillus apis TaxID=2932183 RepID=A0AAU9CSB2_9LACO|nr:hypothetical protein [Xylocopilactobacillus apis]BDR56864.1 hypothetical protein KIMC2_14260 [Xylocopilactobacillus apis]
MKKLSEVDIAYYTDKYKEAGYSLKQLEDYKLEITKLDQSNDTSIYLDDTNFLEYNPGNNTFYLSSIQPYSRSIQYNADSWEKILKYLFKNIFHGAHIDI